MALIAKETQRLSNIVKYEYDPSTRHCRTQVEYTGAAKTFLVGDLVDATGGVPATAADIVGFVTDDVTAPLNVKTVLPVLNQGIAGIVVENLNLGALVKADVIAEFAKRQIKAIDPIVLV